MLLYQSLEWLINFAEEVQEEDEDARREKDRSRLAVRDDVNPEQGDHNAS